MRSSPPCGASTRLEPLPLPGIRLLQFVSAVRGLRLRGRDFRSFSSLRRRDASQPERSISISTSTTTLAVVAAQPRRRGAFSFRSLSSYELAWTC